MIWPKLNTMFSSAGLGHTESHGVTVHGMRKPEKSGGSWGEVVVLTGIPDENESENERSKDGFY